MRFLIMLTCLIPFTSLASIHHVKTMQEASIFFAQADEKTLAAFDIDMVLIQPADPAFQMKNIIQHKHIVKKILGSLTKDEQIAFFALETVRSYPIIIETNTNALLENLNDRRIKTIAITANLTGSFDSKENMQKWVAERLAMCGIDFSHSFSCREEIVFKNLPTHRGNYMLFSDGILFTNGLSAEKGKVLAEFCRRVNFAPRKVIFIDDRLENLQKMAESLEEMNIEFVGLYYTGASDYLSPYVDALSFEQAWLKRANEAKSWVQSDEVHILPIDLLRNSIR